MYGLVSRILGSLTLPYENTPLFMCSETTSILKITVSARQRTGHANRSTYLSDES